MRLLSVFLISGLLALASIADADAMDKSGGGSRRSYGASRVGTGISAPARQIVVSGAAPVFGNTYVDPCELKLT
jgi:hypothetical protein